MLITEKKSGTISTITANQPAYANVNVAKEGYTPLGIVGSGQDYTAGLNYVEGNIVNNTASVKWWNMNSATYSNVPFTIAMLYAKNL